MIAHSSYVKALMVFTLVAYSAASEAAAESRREGVRRSSQALSASHTPVLIKPMLRSHAVMTVTDDHTSTSEERFSFAEHGRNLDQILLKIKDTIQVWWWRLMKRTPTEMVDGMKLSDTIKPGIFESNAFSYWVHLMQSTYVEPPGKGTAKIFEVLDDKLTDVTLAYMIYKAIESDTMQPLMLDLRNAQFEKWLAHEAKPEGVKSMLQAAIKSENDPARKIFDRVAYQYEKFYGKVKITVGDPGTSGEVKLDPSS